MKSKRGFTLIELLVVIGIIGILASIVLASLSTAKARGRDARRAGDIKQLQQAVENYFEDNSVYPPNLASVSSFLSGTPNDPLTNQSYGYAVNASPASYCIGINFEKGIPAGVGLTTACTFNNVIQTNFDNSWNYVVQGP